MSGAKDNGFTLIEVIMATAILSIGLLAISSLTVGIIVGNKRSTDLTTAVSLAQDKMEAVRGLGYTSVAPETEAAYSTPNGTYEREVLVTNNSPGNGMKLVTVRVYWDSWRGASRSRVELVTILSEPSS